MMKGYENLVIGPIDNIAVYYADGKLSLLSPKTIPITMSNYVDKVMSDR